jgi:small subunit ribosomal protein S16
MAVHVRLRRIGKNPKGKIHFRISVFDERTGRDGKPIEELGYYNPMSSQSKMKRERLEYWIKNGAQLSATVKSLLKKERKNAAGTSS